MSLGLWEFFWAWDAGSPAPPPAPPEPPPPPPPPPPGTPAPPGETISGGGPVTNQKGLKPAYVQLSPEYWDVREAALRAVYPNNALPPAPPPDNLAAAYKSQANAAYVARQAEIEQANADRATAIADLRSAPDLATMQCQCDLITTLNSKIATLTGKQSLSRFMK